MLKFLNNYPLSNQMLVKSKKSNRRYIACFKNGQLYIEIFNLKGKSLNYIYEPSCFDENYEVIRFNSKPKKTKSELYHNKTIIYNGVFKCIIYSKISKSYYVNWCREEKGKPMTHKSLNRDLKLMSINDFFIEKYKMSNDLSK